MTRLIGIVVLVLICVAGLGFARSWFSVSTDQTDAANHNVDINLRVDTDKVKADVETVKDKAAELTGNDAGKEAAKESGDQAKEESKKD